MYVPRVKRLKSPFARRLHDDLSTAKFLPSSPPTPPGYFLSKSAGALDGVDHWDSIKSSGFVDKAGDISSDPRTELLYNWDPYLMSTADKL